MSDRDGFQRELAILKGAVENTNEAFVTIDENHKVIFFNKAAEAIFGYSREEVVGRDLRTIMSPGCSRDHRQAVERYIKTRVPGRIGHGTDMEATRKNGDAFPATISFSVFEIDGRLFFTAIIRDLTETKALREQVTKSERLAALGQVVAEITHEIRNPLMVIGGFAQQLAKETSDDDALKKLNIIAEEAARMDRLLNDLGEFYRPRSKPVEDIELNTLLREVFEMVHGECLKRGIEAVMDLDEDPLSVKGDRGRLKQVFLNFAKNALEAMADGGSFSIQSRRKDGLAEVSLTDDGCGIPEADLEKVFSPFFTTKRHGTGLGLSVSKSIIEDNNGTLELWSREGEGATFTVLFPLLNS